jgi:hypothetical protein
MDKPVQTHTLPTKGDIVSLSTSERTTTGIVVGECECGCGMREVLWSGTNIVSRCWPQDLRRVSTNF